MVQSWQTEEFQRRRFGQLHVVRGESLEYSYAYVCVVGGWGVDRVRVLPYMYTYSERLEQFLFLEVNLNVFCVRQIHSHENSGLALSPSERRKSSVCVCERERVDVQCVAHICPTRMRQVMIIFFFFSPSHFTGYKIE